jgi:hypothetical protein
MRPFLNALALALLASSLFPGTALAQQPASILGKADLTGLLGSAPAHASQYAGCSRAQPGCRI